MADPSVKKSKAKGLNQYLSSLLMVVVVVVVYWEETGLQSLFSEDYLSIGSDEFRVVKSSGKGWTVWDKESVLFNENGYACQWMTYTPEQDNKDLTKIEICAHEDTDYISGRIQKVGQWNECDYIRKQWDTKQQQTSRDVYVEIGAHIGACAIEFLVTTKARVVLFEPHPRNLFCLTSTFMKYPALKDRVTIFPIALGKTSAAEVGLEIPKEDDFASVQVQVSPDDEGTGGVSLVEVPMERLDDVIRGGIQVLSMNVNGYECEIIDGGVREIRTTPVTTTPVDPQKLLDFRCSQELLVAKFRSLRLEPKWYKRGGRLRNIPTSANFAYSMVAKKKVIKH